MIVAAATIHQMRVTYPDGEWAREIRGKETFERKHSKLIYAELIQHTNTTAMIHQITGPGAAIEPESLPMAAATRSGEDWLEMSTTKPIVDGLELEVQVTPTAKESNQATTEQESKETTQSVKPINSSSSLAAWALLFCSLLVQVLIFRFGIRCICMSFSTFN